MPILACDLVYDEKWIICWIHACSWVVAKELDTWDIEILVIHSIYLNRIKLFAPSNLHKEFPVLKLWYMIYAILRFLVNGMTMRNFKAYEDVRNGGSGVWVLCLLCMVQWFVNSSLNLEKGSPVKTYILPHSVVKFWQFGSLLWIILEMGNADNNESCSSMGYEHDFGSLGVLRLDIGWVKENQAINKGVNLK